MKNIFLLFLSIFLINLNHLSAFETNRKVDSLLNVLKISKEDTNKVATLNALASTLRKLGELQRGLTYANQALELAKSTRYDIGLVDAYIVQFQLQEALGEFANSLQALNLGMEIASRINYKKGLAILYRSSGVLNNVQNNYVEATKDFYKSLKISEEIGYKQGIAYANNNIGNVYFHQGDLDEAAKYYQITLNLAIQNKERYAEATAYNNLGEVMATKKEYSKALTYYLKSANIKESLEDVRGLTIVIMNIGDIYFIKKDYTKAQSNYEKALKFANKIKDKKSISESNLQLGTLYIYLKKYELSRKFLQASIQLTKETNSRSTRSEAYHSFAMLDSATGDFRSALNYKRLELALNDSILNEKSQLQVSHLKIKYDTEKKTKEVEKLKIENELQTQKASQKNFLIIATLLFSIFVIAIILTQSNNRKKKLVIATNLLDLKSLEIEKAKIVERVKVQKEISEQYHDILGYKITSILLMCENEKKKQTDDTDPLICFAEKVSNKLKEVAETNRSGIIALSSDTDELENFIGELRADLNDLAETTGKEIRFVIPEFLPQIKVEPIIKFNISAAMKEAINNSLKHAKCPFVEVKIEIVKEEFNISISDLGVGMNPEQKKKHGYGLINMRNRMKNLGGDFQIESSPNNGTIVFFKGKFGNLKPLSLATQEV